MRIRDLTISLAVALALAGCDKLNRVKSENPVMGPPPPRLSLQNTEDPHTKYVDSSSVDSNALGEDSPEVVPVAMEPSVPVPGGDLSGTQVVATVDGMPIFASEIVERYSEQLAKAQEQLPPEHFRQARLQLIRRDLESHIDRKVLVMALERSVPPEQMKQLQTHLEGAFQEDIARLREQFNVTSTVELDMQLRQKKTSLSELRHAFINQQMAMQFLGAKSQKKEKIGREDLLKWYHDHEEDYRITGKVKWQQLLISWTEHGGRANALRKLEEAIEELRQGTDFADVARKHSDGPTATDGGNWDWTPEGSLSDERVERTLFQLDVGKISQVLVGEDSFQLVKVIERQDGGMKEFASLQDEIRNRIRQEHRREAAKEILNDLRERALIETIFDAEEAAQPQQAVSEDISLPFN